MSGRLLFLSHRIPYPPDKGEKIRAWHMLDHLADRWQVDAGFFVDDRADLAHVDTVAARCASVMARPALNRRLTAASAVLRARPGIPLTLGWFHDAKLAAWVAAGLAQRRWDAAFVYCAAMAPYVMGDSPGRMRRVLDLVDVDSEKWRAYAAGAGWPMRQVFAREARTLLAFERRAAARFDATLLVSEAEAAHFTTLAPECAARTGWVENGVDMARFDPTIARPNPFGGAEPAIVFTGTMGYRPNVEAVSWFAREVLPVLRRRADAPWFHIIGANPAPAVQALAALPGVRVSGTVPDIRPYLAHAAVVVAPLAIARGIQNKVLEAMAMGRPVVATPDAFGGVRATPGRDLLVAEGAEAFASAVAAVLDGAHPGLGASGRAAVAAGHDWAATLTRLDAALDAGLDAGLAG